MCSAAFGYSEARGCGRAQLCPAFSLPDLFGSQAAAGAQAPKLTTAAVGGLLAAIPPYFSQDVITPRPPLRDALLRHPPDEPATHSST